MSNLSDMYRKATMKDVVEIKETVFVECCETPNIEHTDDTKEPCFVCVNCNTSHNTPIDIVKGN